MVDRVIHLVRCTDPNNSGNWVDIEVTDGWAYTYWNGNRQTFEMPAAKQTGGAIVSHFVTVTNPDDSTQYFDLQVCDGLAFTGPNGDRQTRDFPSVNQATKLSNSDSFSGSFISPEESIVASCPPGNNVAELWQITSNNPPSLSYDNSQGDYIISEKKQGLCFNGPNGDQSTLDFPDSDEVIQDNTQYTTDSDGNQVPPPNGDPNDYVHFTGGGNNLGRAVASMGPLWRIVNKSGGVLVLVTAVNLVIDFSTNDGLFSGSFAPSGSGVKLLDQSILQIVFSAGNITAGTAQAWLLSVPNKFIGTIGTFSSGDYPPDGSFPPWSLTAAWGSGRPTGALIKPWQSTEGGAPTYNDIARCSFGGLVNNLSGASGCDDTNTVGSGPVTDPCYEEPNTGTSFTADLVVQSLATNGKFPVNAFPGGTPDQYEWLWVAPNGSPIFPPAPEFGI